MRVQAKWLPGGSVVLGDIPYAGEEEINRLREASANVESVYMRDFFAKLSHGALAAEKSVQALGVPETKRMWDDYILAIFPKGSMRPTNFVWSVNDFEE